RKAAEAAMHRVEDALHRLAIGLIRDPEGVDPGDYILSGGTLTAPVPKLLPRTVPTLDEALREYRDHLGHPAESNRSTVSGHLRRLKQKLSQKVNSPLDGVEPGDLERFLQARLKERSPTTVSKERVTVAQFFAWATGMGYLAKSPAVNLTR